MTTTEQKQILEWIEKNKWTHPDNFMYVTTHELTAFIESLSTEPQLDHIEVEIDKVQRTFMNHAHGIPDQSLGYIEGLKDTKQLINKIESKKEILRGYGQVQGCRCDISAVSFNDGISAMQEFSDQQNATLIAEHRLMKEALEDISNGSNSFEACIASETLKNITL